MAILPILAALLRARRVSRMSRAQVLALRERRLRQTLFQTWDRSPYYRRLWESRSVARADLATIPLERLPIVTKRDLMEHFEEVVNVPGVTKADAERFIAADPSGGGLYRDRYVAMNTSGSSGYVGIFLFTHDFWHRLLGTLVARLFHVPLLRVLTRRTRLAFLGETSGHHAGISLVNSAPRPLFEVFSANIGAPEEEIAAALNAFRPHVLSGYAAALARAAEVQHAGRLRIKPETVISSGEPLTEARRSAIRQGFGVNPTDLYNATECLAIGADTEGSGVLALFDDIMLLEAVDDAGMPVPAGEVGRVVVTVFGNDIQPLVRYALDDEIVIRPESPTAGPFTQAEHVQGRNLERLTFTVGDRAVVLHPMEVVGFFFPGLRHYQIVQTGPASAKLRVVTDMPPERVEENIRALLSELAREKGFPLQGIEVRVEVVDEISPDPRTGKTPILIPLKQN